MLMILLINVEWVGCWDLFADQPVQNVEDLSTYGIEESIIKSTSWKDLIITRINWITPIRMLRDKSERETAKGEARFCRQASDLSYSLLYQRLYDTFAGIARRNKKVVDARLNPQSLTMAGDIFGSMRVIEMRRAIITAWAVCILKVCDKSTQPHNCFALFQVLFFQSI
jgi:hypothetical protein